MHIAITMRINNKEMKTVHQAMVERDMLLAKPLHVILWYWQGCYMSVSPPPRSWDDPTTSYSIPKAKRLIITLYEPRGSFELKLRRLELQAARTKT